MDSNCGFAGKPLPPFNDQDSGRAVFLKLADKIHAQVQSRGFRSFQEIVDVQSRSLDLFPLGTPIEEITEQVVKALHHLVSSKRLKVSVLVLGKPEDTLVATGDFPSDEIHIQSTSFNTTAL